MPTPPIPSAPNLQDLKESPALSLSIRPMSPIPYPYLAKWGCLSPPLSFLLLRSSHFPHPSPWMGPTSLYLPPKQPCPGKKHLSPATITSCLSKIGEETNAHSEKLLPGALHHPAKGAGRGVKSLQTFVFPLSRPRAMAGGQTFLCSHSAGEASTEQMVQFPWQL